MDNFQILQEKGILTENQAKAAFENNQKRPLSIFWELRVLLSLGVSALSGGLGIIIYENINSFGHNLLLGFILLLCASCYFISIKKRPLFSWGQLKNINIFIDYSILAACLLLLTLVGYVQFRYKFLENYYASIAFCLGLLFMYLAYRFDHRGILVMAIMALGSCLGLNISGVNSFSIMSLNSSILVYSGILFGLVLVIIGWFSDQKNLKKHFTFTYYFLGANLAFISTLTALFNFELVILFLPILLIFSTLCIFHARQTQSYFLLLMGVIYGYIGITYFVINLFSSVESILLLILYFSLSGFGIIMFFLRINSILGITKPVKL
jgi:Predicted membrane protein (DUF2157)